MSDLTKNFAKFRRVLRKKQDQDEITTRELLGLLFDVYELLDIVGEEMRRRDAIDYLNSAMPPIYKVPTEDFEELFKKKRKKEDLDVEELDPRKGYL